MSVHSEPHTEGGREGEEGGEEGWMELWNHNPGFRSQLSQVIAAGPRASYFRSLAFVPWCLNERNVNISLVRLSYSVGYGCVWHTVLVLSEVSSRVYILGVRKPEPAGSECLNVAQPRSGRDRT